MKINYSLDLKHFSSNYESESIIKNIATSNHYEIINDEISIPNDTLKKVSRVLPSELDIFSDIPHEVYNNAHANLFLLSLKQNLLSYDRSILEGITLSKLHLSEINDNDVVLEWIYNYFRLFLAFYSDEGDYYGSFMNNIETGEIINDIKKMTPEIYDQVSKSFLDYAVSLSKGGIIK